MKPQWGAKHECAECGAHFYDMRNPQACCPKCQSPINDKAALMAKVAFEYEPPPKPKSKDILDDLDDFEDDFDTQTDLEDFIEDTEELVGSDETDMSEFIEQIEETRTDQNL